MRISIINGPNLNLLGRREPEIYGAFSLEGINEELARYAETQGAVLSFYQSNHEGEIVSLIQGTFLESSADGIVLNAGGFAHTSIVIRDAIAAVGIPTVEVHISNTAAREPFRHHSMIAGVVAGRLEGLGRHGYRYAIDFLIENAKK